MNPFTPVRIFSDDHIESMHLAALGILERQGMRVLSPRGRAVLAAAGASVDEASQMVRLDPGLVSQALASVPAEVTIVGRNPARSCRIGGKNLVFAPVAGPPSVSDLQRGTFATSYVCRRPSTSSTSSARQPSRRTPW